MAKSKRDVRAKHTGLGLEIKTFEGTKGTYVVFKLPKGGYHAFLEVQAKQAAMDCGSEHPRDVNTSIHWKDLWNKDK